MLFLVFKKFTYSYMLVFTQITFQDIHNKFNPLREETRLWCLVKMGNNFYQHAFTVKTTLNYTFRS